MPKQAVPRTTRNSRGLRRAEPDRESSVDSVDSAALSRRTRKSRARRARSKTPDVADTSTGSPPPSSNPDDAAFAPSATDPSPTPRDSLLITLAPIREEDPRAVSPKALQDTVGQSDHEPAVVSEAQPTPDREGEPAVAAAGLDEHSEPAGLTEAQPTPDLEEEEEEEEEEENPEDGLLADETELFSLRRRQEGPNFGAKLYAAIQAEQFVKNCHCRDPTVHETKKEAEAGTGVFRFYRVGPRADDIGVFMRKGDNKWHCQCYAQYTRFADLPRKRKADDTEIELEARSSREVVDEKTQAAQEPQTETPSMWNAITGRVGNMTASVKRWFNRLGARLTGVAYEVIETCKYDPTKRHVVVKRFKRQYCVPVNAELAQEEEIRFEELPYFDWTDDATKNIGEAAIRSIKHALWRQVLDIRNGFISFDTSIDALRTKHREKQFDLELSIGVHDLMMKHYGEATMETYLKAAEEYCNGAGVTVDFIQKVYLNPKLLPLLKKEFAKPPKQLNHFGDFVFKMQTRQAGDFLTWMLSKKELFHIDGDYQLAMTKIIVDIDAVHKQEILPSLVQFPGNNADVMPGSFPLQDDIIEEVPVGDFVIEPVYECKHPDSRPPTSSSSSSAKAQAPKTKHLKFPLTPRPKGILRKQPKDWPENPISPEVGGKMTPQKLRRLRFESPVAFFTPPKRSPRRRPFGETLPAGKVARSPLGKVERSPIGKVSASLPASPSKMKVKDYLIMSLYKPTFDLDDPSTKYGEFLDKARHELYNQPGFRAPPGPRSVLERAKADEAMRKPRETMTPEERRHEMDLFVRDLELGPNGEVMRRKLLVPEAELMIATRKLEDIDLTRQVRHELEVAAEKERQRMAELLAEEKRLRIEEEKRKEEEQKRRREEQERRQQEQQLRTEQEAQRLRAAEERAAKTQLRAPTRPIVEPISEEWRAKIINIAAANPATELTKTLEGQALTRRDFEEKLLPATAWLNDNIITGSILYVGDHVNAKAGATAQDPKCATFTSYFWPRLESAGPAQCARLMRRAGVRKDNFLNLESILIPICSGSHWTLAVVLPGRRIIAHMDSLRGGHGNPSVTRRLSEWVKVTLGELFVEDDWQVVDLDAPRQRNGWDCGVFAITNALCLALGLDPNESYTAEELTLQRQRLAAVLLNGGFKGDFDLEGL